mmetsp:Transcript_35648/g.36133  ORF Transcript_35648/g.36133 Transcript_35648/m.36133 type:complete len:131 (-) Transcript_35648:393-785(-)
MDLFATDPKNSIQSSPFRRYYSLDSFTSDRAGGRHPTIYVLLVGEMERVLHSHAVTNPALLIVAHPYSGTVTPIISGIIVGGFFQSERTVNVVVVVVKEEDQCPGLRLRQLVVVTNILISCTVIGDEKNR